MRISTSMINANLAQRLADSTESMYRLQQQISSGQRLTAPSDDPTAAARAAGLTSSLSQVAQYTDSVDVATQKLNTVDSLLSDLTSVLQSARDTAIQAADDTLSDESLAALATQVDGVIQQVMDLANSESNGYYVFSGFSTTTLPFAATGGTAPAASYAGDSGAQSIAVGRNASVIVNITGDQLFNMGGAADASLDDLFTTLTTLRDCISAGDSAAVSQCLEDIDAHLGRVGTYQAEIGGRLDQLELATTRLESMQDTMTSALSDVADTDLVQAAVDLQSEQTVYQATAAIASQVSQLTLLNYLT